MLPFFRRLGGEFPDFDFSVPGVSSISMDLHKYAYTPKGASLVLYRNKELRKHQIYACARWTGYSVVNNAVQSSKSGGPMAAAWAVLNYMGDDGYLELARKKREATQLIAEGIDRHPDLQLMAWPDMCMLSFTSETVNVFHLIDEMNMKGWYIQPALTFDNSRANIHMSINVSNVEWVESFLKDLEECVKSAKKIPSGELAGFVEQALAGKEASDLTDQEFAEMLQMAGISGDSGLPERMAEINEVLNALTSAFRERLLVEFVNDLFRP
jgi:glutamate/tyrosine decarboxylase-like PLP-dependent enzyme